MKKEDSSQPLSPDETLDIFFNGKLKIFQKKRGYRFSIDAILLAQFVRIRKDERVVDLGTGCGILPLLLSQTSKASSFIGVEIQKGLAECAAKNVIFNQLEDRISIFHRDFTELKTVFPSNSFHVVVSNPPYRKFRTGRINPHPEKAIARHEIKANLNDLTSVLAHLLKQKGRAYIIFPATRTADLLTSLRHQNLEPKRVQFVHSRAEEEAKFILVEAIKFSGVELHVMPPRILHP